MPTSYTLPPQARPRAGFALLVALLAMVCAGKAVLSDTLDPDCFWHLRVGQELAQLGWPRPLVDDLSFGSAKTPWTPYSWLAEIAMKKLWDAGGYQAAVAVQALMEAAFIVLIALCGLEASETAIGQPRYLASAVSAAAAALLSLAYLSFRPVTMALALLALVAYLLLRDRRLEQRSKAVWAVPAIAVVLTNIHFFSLMVPLWTTALLAGDAIQKTGRQVRGLVLVILSLAGCAATPLLPGMMRAVVHYSFGDVLVHSGMIVEMQPFYRGTMGMIAAVLAGMMILCAIVGFLKHRKPGLGELIWLGGTGVMLFTIGRMAPVFAIIAAPLFAATAPALSDRVLFRPAICLMLAAVVALGAWRIARGFPSADESLDTWLNRNAPYGPAYPCAAANFVQEHIPVQSGRIICEFPWGGYLEWRLGNHFQMLMDGRTQVFTADFWKSVYFDGDGAREGLLRQTHADAAIVPAKRSLFLPELKEMGWKPVYADEYATVLIPP